MTIIKLNRVDFRTAKPTALALAEFWHNENNSEKYPILEGIFAEYAAIKYLNEYLGATPKIEFNTVYVNGGDGGFDFKFIDKLKWDVKSTSSEAIPGKLLSATSADIVVGVQRIKGFKFDIWGFIPVSRINPEREYRESDFREIDRLKASWPSHFAATALYPKSTRTDLTPATPLINDVMASFRLEIDPEYKINRTYISDREKRLLEVRKA